MQEPIDQKRSISLALATIDKYCEANIFKERILGSTLNF
jgi:hypothetical protein